MARAEPVLVSRDRRGSRAGPHPTPILLPEPPEQCRVPALSPSSAAWVTAAARRLRCSLDRLLPRLTSDATAAYRAKLAAAGRAGDVEVVGPEDEKAARRVRAAAAAAAAAAASASSAPGVPAAPEVADNVRLASDRPPTRCADGGAEMTPEAASGASADGDSGGEGVEINVWCRTAAAA
jgi:hypothetical protein